MPRYRTVSDSTFSPVVNRGTISSLTRSQIILKGYPCYSAAKIIIVSISLATPTKMSSYFQSSRRELPARARYAIDVIAESCERIDNCSHRH